MTLFLIMSITALATVVIIIIQDIIRKKQIKEIEKMKFEDFKKKFEEIYKSKDGTKLAAFMARHTVFIIKHQNEVTEFMRALSNGEINKKE